MDYLTIATFALMAVLLFISGGFIGFIVGIICDKTYADKVLQKYMAIKRIGEKDD